jgi:hypothetical protein
MPVQRVPRYKLLLQVRPRQSLDAGAWGDMPPSEEGFAPARTPVVEVEVDSEG